MVYMVSIEGGLLQFQRKKIKILKPVKLQQQNISSGVLVTAIDVNCNFTEQINANPGKMLNTTQEKDTSCQLKKRIVLLETFRTLNDFKRKANIRKLIAYMLKSTCSVT